MVWLLLGFGAGAAEFQRTSDVVYGRKHGVALTLDVFQPTATNNGVGLIAVVSGGWYSAHEAINPAFYRPFLDRGYTVFAVVHGSQPKFIIPEIVQDLHRAVRFIRHEATRFGVTPERLGIFGGSAGAHLSLMIATRGGPGDPQAKDPVDRASSAVQAVAGFFPPTDFLNYGAPGRDALRSGALKNFLGAFGPRAESDAEWPAYAREISPVYAIGSNMPPTLLIHGDADQLVPLQQAELFIERARQMGATVRLIVREGKGHGWPDLVRDLELFADWFDAHLRERKAAP